MKSTIEEDGLYHLIKCMFGVLVYFILLAITNYYYYYKLQKTKKPLYRTAKTVTKKKSVDSNEAVQDTSFVYSNEKIKKD